jgi:leucyl aminopeptidase
MVALGFRTAGLFGNNQDLIELIKSSAEETDEPVCQLPITDADEKAMKGKLADLTNLAMDHGYAGSSRAAAFLKNFVNGTKWAHIDIAGTAYTKDPKDYETNMGTGFGVRLMIDFLEKVE